MTPPDTPIAALPAAVPAPPLRADNRARPPLPPPWRRRRVWMLVASLLLHIALLCALLLVHRRLSEPAVGPSFQVLFQPPGTHVGKPAETRPTQLPAPAQPPAPAPTPPQAAVPPPQSALPPQPQVAPPPPQLAPPPQPQVTPPAPPQVAPPPQPQVAPPPRPAPPTPNMPQAIAPQLPQGLPAPSAELVPAAPPRPPAAQPLAKPPAAAAPPPAPSTALAPPLPVPQPPSPPRPAPPRPSPPRPAPAEQPEVRLSIAPPLFPPPEPESQPEPQRAPPRRPTPPRRPSFPLPMNTSLGSGVEPSRSREAERGTGAINLALGRAIRDSNGAPPRDTNAAKGDIVVRGAHVGKDWEELLHEWWLQHGYYPEEAAKHGEDGRVAIHVRVDRYGHVEQVELESSSGSQWLDMGAQATFRGAHLPPFPPSTPEPVADLDITINYILVRH